MTVSNHTPGNRTLAFHRDLNQCRLGFASKRSIVSESDSVEYMLAVESVPRSLRRKRTIKTHSSTAKPHARSMLRSMKRRPRGLQAACRTTALRLDHDLLEPDVDSRRTARTDASVGVTEYGQVRFAVPVEIADMDSVFVVDAILEGNSPHAIGTQAGLVTE